MAKNVVINSVTYSSVPYVSIPLSDDTGNATFYETSTATADAAKILSGYSAYGPSGLLTGTMTAASVSQDSTTNVLSIS